MLIDFRFRPRAAALVLLLSQLPGCGIEDAGLSTNSSGNNNSKSGASETTTLQRAGDTLHVLSGSVGDGPITGATITIYSASGDVLGTTYSDSNASYHFSLFAEPQDYPLMLEVSGGIDLVTGTEPDFRMHSIVASDTDEQVNINPFTTVIVRSARLMADGMSPENIELAKRHVADELGFGLDPDSIPDPVTTRITESNIAHIVKSSEAMGEMIRRVRDASANAGEQLSGDDIMDVISADMSDGKLDGQGSTGAHPEMAALARLVMAQVLVESMVNQLKVGGVPASQAMDDAIRISYPFIEAPALTDGVTVTPGHLKQTRGLLEDMRLRNDPDFPGQLADALLAIQQGMHPGDVALLLPVDAGNELESRIGAAAGRLVSASSKGRPVLVRRFITPGMTSAPNRAALLSPGAR